MPVNSRLLLTAVIVMVMGVGLAQAQNPDGALVGTVTDSAGARVAGARVAAEARASKLQRQGTTNADGEFRLESLPPGDYRVTVSASGFADSVLDVRVAVSSSPTLTITLKPAGARETVQVQGAVSLTSQPLETTSSVEKTVISAKDLQDLPLAHRSFANIAYLA